MNKYKLLVLFGLFGVMLLLLFTPFGVNRKFHLIGNYRTHHSTPEIKFLDGDVIIIHGLGSSEIVARYEKYGHGKYKII